MRECVRCRYYIHQKDGACTLGVLDVVVLDVYGALLMIRAFVRRVNTDATESKESQRPLVLWCRFTWRCVRPRGRTIRRKDVKTARRCLTSKYRSAFSEVPDETLFLRRRGCEDDGM